MPLLSRSGPTLSKFYQVTLIKGGVYLLPRRTQAVDDDEAHNGEYLCDLACDTNPRIVFDSTLGAMNKFKDDFNGFGKFSFLH